MYIHGEFANQIGQVVAVEIVTKGSRAEELEIGGGDVYFTDDPVEISDDTNDTFDVLLCRSASVRLLCRDFVPDFFCASSRDAVVNIRVDGECVFAGFVEPQTYSQSYNELYDEVELNCVDALSALQYSKYKNVGAAGVSYSDVKLEAETRTFSAILSDVLGEATDGLDLSGGSVRFWYDGSKAVSAEGGTLSAFTGIALDELLFMGDEEDDVWTQDTVLEEILRYLDLHIVQDGFDFYVFSWASVKSDAAISWTDLFGSGTTKETESNTVEISTANVADTGTKISIGEVYNQLLLTCNVESMENLIESPLDDDSLVSPYSGKQLYMTEYIGHSRSETEKLIKGQATTDEDNTEIDWYLQLMVNPKWKFYYDGTNTIDKLFQKVGDTYINQWYMAKHLKNNACVPCLFRLGSVEKKSSASDDSPTSSIGMTTYLYISANGSEIDKDGQELPSETTIKGHSPMMEYVGNTSGGVYSPSDENTTNYIVFSGSLLLQPVVYESSSSYADRNNNYADIVKNGLGPANRAALRPTYDMEKTIVAELLGKSNMVKSEKWDDGKYYSRRFYGYKTPTGKDEAAVTDKMGIQPWTSDKGGLGYEYNFSEANDRTDKFKKLPVLECELIIGDKRLVETDIDEYGNSTFKWYKVGEEPIVTDDDGNEARLTTFSLGVNPKIGDEIIGTEFDIQNTIDYTMNLDTEGTAIPIKRSDKVSGKVTFRILGPINLAWNDITYRKHSFWRHTKFYENLHAILTHTESIIIKDFECKVYSDNGLSDTSSDNDIVYMSDTDETYVNKKDDLGFKICSALTTEECQELGVSNALSLSTPLDVESGVGLLTIYDTAQGVAAKAEQLYVDAYYRELHKPRVSMEQNLMESGFGGLFAHYLHPALDKEFFVLGMGRNLMEGVVSLNLKEIGND